MKKEIIEMIARIAYEVNRAYRTISKADIGDKILTPWNSTPEERKSRIIAGVQHLIDNPGTSPQEMHETWMKYMTDTGWLFGEKEDPVTKTHPCLVPYGELPFFEQMKDALFIAVVEGVREGLPEEAPAPALMETGMKFVKYVGHREVYSDGLFNTGIWKQGEVKPVATLIATKMFEHPSVYQETSGEMNKFKMPEKTEEDDDSLDDTEALNDARDLVMTFYRKSQVLDYISNTFPGLPVEVTEKDSLSAHKQFAIRLIDQFHIPK